MRREHRPAPPVVETSWLPWSKLKVVARKWWDVQRSGVHTQISRNERPRYGARTNRPIYFVNEEACIRGNGPLRRYVIMIIIALPRVVTDHRPAGAAGLFLV